MYVTNDWDRLYSGREVEVVPLTDAKTARLVEKHDRPQDGYGDYMQGDSECWMIFEVDGRYFKKTGYQSSYGDERSWDGPVTEVKATKKEVLVFE